METINLPYGQRAADNVDCIHIERGTDGHFYLNASTLADCDDADEAESVAVIGGDAYPSDEAAEAAGLAWAAEQCVAKLYISRSDEAAGP